LATTFIPVCASAIETPGFNRASTVYHPTFRTARLWVTGVEVKEAGSGC